MSTTKEIQDMIATCDLVPSEDTTDRLLQICASLLQRVELLEQETASLRAKLKGLEELKDTNGKIQLLVENLDRKTSDVLTGVQILVGDRFKR